MRKVLGILLDVFVAAFIFGATAPSADAGPCYYKWSCTGSLLKCCINSFGVEVCKPAGGVFYCQAIITC
jgi:hypothetical protein